MDFIAVIVIAAYVVIPYLIGSIPFGLIVGKLAGIGDIRNTGSGNIGATNMVRAGGKKLGAMVLVLDALKGAIPIFLLMTIQGTGKGYGPGVIDEHGVDENIFWIIGYCIVLGHMFPIWLKFKGGKGVATSLGVIAVISPVFFLLVCAVWLAIFLATQYSSLAAIVAFIALPLFYLIGGDAYGWPLLLSLMVILKHHENVKRLLNGTESKFSFSKKV